MGRYIPQTESIRQMSGIENEISEVCLKESLLRSTYIQDSSSHLDRRDDDNYDDDNNNISPNLRHVGSK